MLKKYPNRRIYDTEENRYVTVQEISQRVVNGEDVLSHRGHADISAEVLTHIIKLDKPSANELRALIKAYRSARRIREAAAKKTETAA